MVFVVEGGVGGFFFFQAEDGIRDIGVTGVQTCALPIYRTKVTLIIKNLYVISTCRTKSVYQGQVVFISWNCISCILFILIMDNLIMFMRYNSRHNIVIKFLRHRCPSIVVPFNFHEIVNNITTGKNQVPLTSKRLKFLSQIIYFFFRKLSIYRKLYNRYISIWEHMNQNCPNTMVNPPLIIYSHTTTQNILNS